MRVGIDARMLRMTGIGSHLQNLLAGLAALDRESEYVLFLRPRDLEGFVPPGPNFLPLPCEAPIYGLAEQVRLPRAIGRARPDLVHHPHYAIPLLGRGPRVVTVHDLIHLLFPEQLPRPRFASRLYARWMVGWAVRRAARVIAVSENSKRDLVRLAGAPPEKVRVIHNGLSEDFRPSPDAAAWGRLRERLGVRGEFFLYVGNLKPHKNVPLLLRAFARVRERVPCELVLTAERGALAGELASLGPAAEGVRCAGGLGRGELLLLYSRALALVFPSRYEGFGLPPLEAMACGAPAVVSDAASLPEVVGDAGLVVPCGDVDRLASAMYDVATDGRLREELGRRGLARARLFSAERMARETLSLYREVAEEGRASRRT